jgi:hypothetical protein
MNLNKIGKENIKRKKIDKMIFWCQKEKGRIMKTINE